MVDQHVYLDILKRNLKKFFEQNHKSTNKALFWLDKASVDHVSTVTTWLEREGIVSLPIPTLLSVSSSHRANFGYSKDESVRTWMDSEKQN